MINQMSQLEPNINVAAIFSKRGRTICIVYEPKPNGFKPNTEIHRNPGETDSNFIKRVENKFYGRPNTVLK